MTAITRLKALLHVTAAKLDEKEDDDFVRCQLSFTTQVLFSTNPSDETTVTKLLLGIKCLTNLCSSTHRNNLLSEVLQSPENKLDPFIGLLTYSLFHASSYEVVPSLIGLLCNLTRDELWTNRLCAKNPERFVDRIFSPQILQIDNSLPLLLNLTANLPVRQYISGTPFFLDWLVESLSNEMDLPHRYILLVGIIKNLCFDDTSHKALLDPQTKLLQTLLIPLCGPEDEVDDEDREKLPKKLQKIVGNPSTRRSKSAVLKSTICQALLQLCATSTGRMSLRDAGTYFILRELHKHENRERKRLDEGDGVTDEGGVSTNSDELKSTNELLYDIEQVVDQLICEENERDLAMVEKSLRAIEVDPKTSTMLEQSKVDFISTN